MNFVSPRPRRSRGEHRGSRGNKTHCSPRDQSSSVNCRHCNSCYCFRAREHCFCCSFYCPLKGFQAIQVRPYESCARHDPKWPQDGGKLSIPRSSRGHIFPLALSAGVTLDEDAGSLALGGIYIWRQQSYKSNLTLLL